MDFDLSNDANGDVLNGNDSFMGAQYLFPGDIAFMKRSVSNMFHNSVMTFSDRSAVKCHSCGPSSVECVFS
jgi:hypothetical protein